MHYIWNETKQESNTACNHLAFMINVKYLIIKTADNLLTVKPLQTFVFSQKNEMQVLWSHPGCGGSPGTGWWSTPGCAGACADHSQCLGSTGEAPRKLDWSVGISETCCPSCHPPESLTVNYKVRLRDRRRETVDMEGLGTASGKVAFALDGAWPVYCLSLSLFMIVIMGNGWPLAS